MVRAKVQPVKLSSAQQKVIADFARAMDMPFSAALKYLVREGAKQHGYDFPKDENTHGGNRKPRKSDGS